MNCRLGRFASFVLIGSTMFTWVSMATAKPKKVRVRKIAKVVKSFVKKGEICNRPYKAYRGSFGPSDRAILVLLDTGKPRRGPTYQAYNVFVIHKGKRHSIPLPSGPAMSKVLPRCTGFLLDDIDGDGIIEPTVLCSYWHEMEETEKSYNSVFDWDGSKFVKLEMLTVKIQELKTSTQIRAKYKSLRSLIESTAKKVTGTIASPVNPYLEFVLAKKMRAIRPHLGKRDKPYKHVYVGNFGPAKDSMLVPITRCQKTNPSKPGLSPKCIITGLLIHKGKAIQFPGSTETVELPTIIGVAIGDYDADGYLEIVLQTTFMPTDYDATENDQLGIRTYALDWRKNALVRAKQVEKVLQKARNMDSVHLTLKKISKDTWQSAPTSPESK